MLCNIIKVANENALWLEAIDTMESSSMISTSYFLGKDVHQVNGFFQDFLILFFNSTLK